MFTNNYIVFDFETSNFNFGTPFDERNTPVAITALYNNGKIRKLYHYHYRSNLYSNCNHSDIENLFKANKEATIIGHNVKFDVHWLNRLGIEHGNSYFDTMFPAYIWKNGKRGKKGDLSLDRLSGHTKQTLGNMLVHKDGINPADIPPKWIVEYNISDVIATERLALAQRERIQLTQKRIDSGIIKNKNLYNSPIRLMQDLLPCIIEMESNGAKVDVDKLREIRKESEKKLQTLTEEIAKTIRKNHNIEAFNFNSGEQVSWFIYSRRLSPEKRGKWASFFSKYNEFSDPDGTEFRYMVDECYEKLDYGLNIDPEPSCIRKTKLSTDVDNLKKLLLINKDKEEIEEVRKFYEIKRLEHLIETYIGSEDSGKGTLGNVFKHNGGWFLHTSYNQIITVTGRLSSSNPNLQNWPRAGTFPVRQAVISRFDPGFICKSDASQLELRYGMWYYKDKQGYEDFLNDIDIHENVAKSAYKDKYIREEHRDPSKQTVFKVWYRGSAYSIVRDPKVPITDKYEAQRIIDSIYERYPQVKEGQERDFNTVINQGYLETPTGRVYIIEGPDWGKKFKIANYPIQGGATGDLIPCGMIVKHKMMKEENLESKFFAQTHDDVSTDTKASEAERICKIDEYSLTEGAKKEWETRFGIPFDFPLKCEPELKEHW